MISSQRLLPNMRKRIFLNAGRNQGHPPLRPAFGLGGGWLPKVS
jgi:hypothetical protein